MRILCFGDSNTYGYDPRGYFGGRYDRPWPELLAELSGWDVCSDGSCGRAIPRRGVHFPKNEDLVIVMLGTNDLLQGASAEETGKRMRAFLSTMERKSILLLASPAFARGEWISTAAQIEESRTLARVYRELAHELGIRFLDAGEWGIRIAYDGVHFTEEGHRMFAQRLREGLTMIDCISVSNMRDSDAYTIEHFVSSRELMARAAMGVFLAHSWKGRTAIVTGSGNNGGDGFALACILKERGFACTVFTVSDRLSADSAFYAARAGELGISVRALADDSLTGYDTVVDCLLGTGFQGPVRENYRHAIEVMNQSGAFVISVDINSGMNGDTGAGEWVVSSDLTVTIGFLKHGLVTENAGNYMKRLVRTDIGIRLCRRERVLTPPEYPKWLDPEPIFSLGGELRT